MDVRVIGAGKAPQARDTILPVFRAQSADLVVDERQGLIIGPTTFTGECGRNEKPPEDNSSVESKDEDEDNDEVETNKSGKLKGFQTRDSGGSFRCRKMVWEKSDDRWQGRWMWMEWKTELLWERSVEDQHERAIRAWDVTSAPDEVLARVVESLVESLTRDIEDAAKATDFPEPVTGLSNLALVCRAWHTLVEPALYGRLDVRDEVLGFPLRQSLARYARQIRVSTNRPLPSSARIAQIGPRPSAALWLWWQGAGSRELLDKAAYHPSHAVIYSQIHRSYSNVVRLDLWNYSFLSSSDFLRLLAAFSALERVLLFDVSVGQVSDTLVRRERPSTSPIRYIDIGPGCTPPNLPFLTRCWTWTWAINDRPAINVFPAEQQLLARVIREATVVVGSYHLDPMDIGGRTCVAMLRNNEAQVEFHTSQDDPHHPARIHHCLLRMLESGIELTYPENLAAFVDAFASLVYLKTIVLETSPRFRADEIKALLQSLRKVSRAEVQHRTCDEAHRIALQAKNSPSRPTSAGLLSPFWCLQEHAWQWDPFGLYNWLSEDYWTSLKDEDKQPWDPSHRLRLHQPLADNDPST